MDQSCGSYYQIIGINPNGIRAYLNNAADEVKSFCLKYNPDIILFNETKGNQDKHDKEIAPLASKTLPGYLWIWNHGKRPGYAGTAIAVKPNIQIKNIDYGFGDGEKESEGRLITLELENCFIVGLYGVNSGSNRLDYKIVWLTKLISRLEQLKSLGKPVLAFGDWNVAPQPIDVHDPIGLKDCAGFTIEERTCFNQMLNLGWIDVFRYLHPNQVGYTFFSGRSKKQGGWRIDHIISDANSIKSGKLKFEYFDILTQDGGSDHVPIVAKFYINLTEYKLPELNIIKENHGLFVSIDNGTIWENPFKLTKQDKKDKVKRKSSLIKYETHLREKIALEISMFQPIMYDLVTKNYVLTCRCRRGCHGKIILKILSEFVSHLRITR